MYSVIYKAHKRKLVKPWFARQTRISVSQFLCTRTTFTLFLLTGEGEKERKEREKLEMKLKYNFLFVFLYVHVYTKVRANRIALRTTGAAQNTSNELI